MYCDSGYRGFSEKALYDAVAPTYPESHFQTALDRLDKRFPGSGPLVERYDAWRRAFVIPREKVDSVVILLTEGSRKIAKGVGGRPQQGEGRIAQRVIHG